MHAKFFTTESRCYQTVGAAGYIHISFNINIVCASLVGQNKLDGKPKCHENFLNRRLHFHYKIFCCLILHFCYGSLFYVGK